ncbi:MAG: protein translocase subunit SecF, partial [Steroidobacteraceae bacterium]
MEFFSHQTSFQFMATRKVWYTLSAVLMLASIVSFFTRGLNLGIDFTGGVSAQANFTRVVGVDDVRSKLAAAGFHEPQVQNFGSSRDLVVRLPPEPGQTAAAIRTKVETVVKSIDPGAQVLQLDVVGPQVGNELRTSAIWALSFTLLLIFIYIAFRFHTWRLSFGAILAVLHDPILV